MSRAWLKRIDLETFESERLELPAEGDEVSVGRTKQNAIAISSGHVAREHCVLVRTASGWVVEDRNSSSGTWINGHRTTRARLAHGDVIDLYGALLVFLDRLEHRAPEAEAALDRTPHDRGAVLVWADRLGEHGDPLGAQLMTGVVDPACLEGLAPLCEAGRVELDWRGGLVERARVRCTSDATFQDVDLLGRLVSLRVCRWLTDLTVDLCTWTMPASSRLQSDAAAALRGLLSGAELPALEALSLGYLSTPLPASHFREALLDRLPARFPLLKTPPVDVLPLVRHAWLEVERRSAEVEFQHVGPQEGGRIPLHTGVWVGGATPTRLRAIAPGVRREGVRESFLIRQEAPQWCLVPVEHGVLLNGRPAVSTRLLPGDVIEEPRGTRFRFVVRVEPSPRQQHTPLVVRGTSPAGRKP
ncbi:MAG: FHA domain-containing protein [Myxococcales bacterium]|nr:FHA domain-containing protein [Myxococcales bacterium]MDP3501901.1 FHA domain-containing protein [Myxococcales bacterium]